MKRTIVLGLAVLIGAGACGKGGGGDDESAQLRAEVAALRQQIATTATTPTTQAPVTTTTEAPTTTTTVAVRQPQGTVEWTGSRNVYDGPPCTTYEYVFVNRSDTAVLNVKVSGVKASERFFDPAKGYESYRDGNTFPPQTIAAGIPPYGETTVHAKWCNPKLNPGTTTFGAIHDNARFTWEWVAQ